MIFLISVVVVIQIISALVMQFVAKKKKANESFWFICGLILGPFVFLAIPFIPKR